MINPADKEFFYPNHSDGGVAMGQSSEIIDIIERLGVPFAVVCASFYFILYLVKLSAKERETFWKRDAENDERLMKLVEASSDALLQVKIALEANTQAMREMVRYKA